MICFRICSPSRGPHSLIRTSGAPCEGFASMVTVSIRWPAVLDLVPYSFRLDARRAHDGAPSCMFGPQILTELLRRAAPRLAALLLQPLDHVGMRERAVAGRIELRNDPRRGSRRRYQRLPVIGLEAVEALLGHSWNVRQRRQPHGRRGCQGAQMTTSHQ